MCQICRRRMPRDGGVSASGFGVFIHSDLSRCAQFIRTDLQLQQGHTKSHRRPNHMPGDVVPAEAEVVAAGRIDATFQQRGNGLRTGETAGGVLVVAIGEIPKQVVAAAIDERQLFFRQRVQALCREGIIVV